jgi:TonB family protein
MRATLVVFIIAATNTAIAAQRGAPLPPPPTGQEIVARDGDRVIIEDNARVQIVRRRQAMVRAIFHQDAGHLIVLVDYAANAGELPDGNVDYAYRFNDVEGRWPLDARWEGFATLDEYLQGPAPSARGLGLNTPLGLIQVMLRSSPVQQPLPDASAVAVLSARGLNSSGLGRIPAVSFDQVEAEQVALAASRTARQPGSRASEPPTGVIDAVVGVSAWSASNSGSGGAPGVVGAVRVGGAVRSPQKIRDIAPIYPDQARQANVRGSVILEITIGVDGFVSDARVLRSIPLLDAAAVAAVRQWQYQPTLLNGAAVPVTMTVTVPVGP